MARIRKYDWDGLLAEWIAIKGTEPYLTHTAFFKRKGIPVGLAHKKIGTSMSKKWDKVKDAALARTQKTAEMNLTKELSEIMKISKALMSRGTKAIFGPLLDGQNVEVRPEKFEDAVSAIKNGASAI